MAFGAWLALIALIAAVLFTTTPRFDPKSLANKHVIVTGASQGIGEELAYELAKLNASVVLLARSEQKLQVVAERCRSLGAASAHVLAVDLSARDEDTFARAVHDAVGLFPSQGQDPKLDMLILNHLSTSGLVHSVWRDAFKLDVLVDQYFLNVFSYFAMAQHALPLLQQQGGHLVVVSSMTGVMGLPKVVGYASQKHALHGYFNSLRSNLASLGVTNTSITLAVLGAIDTDSMRNAMQDVASSDHKIQVQAASPSQTARQIIESGATRQRTLYYPYHLIRPAQVMSVFFPELMDWVARQAM